MKPTPIANNPSARNGLEQSTNIRIKVAINGTNKPNELNSLRTVLRVSIFELISLSLSRPDMTAHDQQQIYGNDEYKPFYSISIKNKYQNIIQ
jgi:hypothetical protein